MTITTNHPNFVSSAWLDEHRADFFRLQSINYENALYWMDEHDEKLSMAFPAILNLDKTFIHNERYDILREIQVL